MEDSEVLKSMTVIQLHSYCKENNIHRYSKYRKSDLINYVSKEIQANGKQFFCDVCGKHYKELNKDSHMKSSEHKDLALTEGGIKLIETASESRLRTYSLGNSKEFDTDKNLKTLTLNKIKKLLKGHNLKVNFKLICENVEGQEFCLKTNNTILLESTNLESFYDDVVNELLDEIDYFCRRRSNWNDVRIIDLELRTNKYLKFGRRHIKSMFLPNIFIKYNVDRLPEKTEENEAIINFNTIQPDEQPYLQFKKYQHSLRIAFVIYAIIGDTPTSGETPAKFSYYVKYAHKGCPRELAAYKVSNTVEKFVKQLREDTETIKSFTEKKENDSKDISSMINYDEGRQKGNKCHICEKEFAREKGAGEERNFLKVRDHCHLTGEYRGPAHSICNLHYRNPKFIPVFIKNLSKNVVRLLIKEIGVDKVSDVILDSGEKFTSFNAKFGNLQLRFIDSFQFFDSGRKDLSKELNQLYSTYYKKNTQRHGHDVLILADVIEKFRYICLAAYKLDPAWYRTASKLAWDAMLRRHAAEIKLELMTNHDMILMLEKAARSRMPCYAKINNEGTDNSKASKDVSHKSASNSDILKSQYLPYKGFKWKETEVDVNNIPGTPKTGYLLEVDFENPPRLRNRRSGGNDRPEKAAGKQVVYYRNLQQYLEMGLKIGKIHRILEFSQKAWFEIFVNSNAEMTEKAADDFEKYFFKLMNNAVFTDSVLNATDRTDVKLCDSGVKLEKVISKPEFKDRTIIDEDVVAVHMNKKVVVLEPLVYLRFIGRSILQLSE